MQVRPLYSTKRRTEKNEIGQTNDCVLKMTEEISENTTDKRVSPLRGGMSQEEIVGQTKIVRNGLTTLRDEHYTVLANIRDEFENQKNTKDHHNQPSHHPSNGCKVPSNAASGNLLEERIANVTQSLEKLEVGIAESSVLLGLHDHFERLEADRCTLRLEMGRVQDENEWLREELSDTQKQLQEALAELAEIREEKKQWQFQEELRAMSESVTSNAMRPMTPSKIPVGSWRVEEEKDINRALSSKNGLSNGETRSRATSPAPSRIPLGGWRNKLSVYKKVMEKQEADEKAKASEKKKTSSASLHRKGHYFKLNAPARAPKIPTR